MLKDAMPPTHIVVSTAEVLLDDGTRMYDKMRQAGVYVTIEHYIGKSASAHKHPSEIILFLPLT